jgi:hypothetical protein
MGLCSIACTEIKSPGGCMVAQIVQTVTKRDRASDGGSQPIVGGKRQDTRKRVEKQVPRFKDDEVMDAFDKIFAELYPGEAVSEEDYKEGLVEPTRPAPYKFGGWREVGITSPMCVRFCEMMKISLRIVYRNKLLYTSGESDDHHMPVMLYSIFGDHAFFYDDSATKRGSSQLGQGTLKLAINAAPDPPRLRLPQDEDDLVPFADMEEYASSVFHANLKLDKPLPKTYYCYPSQIKAIKAELEAANVAFWVGLGNSPESIRSLNLKFGRGKKSVGPDVKVRTVPENAHDLEGFCEAFGELTAAPNRPHGLKLTYNGDSISSLMMRALNRLAVTQRREWTAGERRTILERQKCLCPGCGDKLDKYEIDHINPLCRGGTNDVSNLQAICPPCHSGKTQIEQQDTGRMIESQMSPKLWNELHRAPKPVEVSWGTTVSTEALAKKLTPRRPNDKQKQKLKGRLEWAKKAYKTIVKTKHVKDLLLKRANPRTTTTKPVMLDGINELRCMDAKSCRVNGLTKRTRGLPIFSPLDEPRTFYAEELPSLDFVYVDAGKKVTFPYTGSRWYSAELVEHMLETSIIEEEHCEAGLEASRHMSPALLEEYFEIIRNCWQKYVYDKDGNEGKFRAEKYIKQAILSLIGLWNATEQFAWKRVRSTYQTDAGKNVKLRRDLGDGSYEFTCSTEIVSLYSMAPFGRIALDYEQMCISKALLELARHDEITMVGAHVDGVYFLAPSWSVNDILQQLESRYLFPDNSPMFHIKIEPVSKVPTYEQNVEPRVQNLTFDSHIWNIVVEETLDDRVKDSAKLFLENGGLLLTGAAGVGKTVLIHMLLQELHRLCPQRQADHLGPEALCGHACGRQDHSALPLQIQQEGRSPQGRVYRCSRRAIGSPTPHLGPASPVEATGSSLHLCRRSGRPVYAHLRPVGGRHEGKRPEAQPFPARDVWRPPYKADGLSQRDGRHPLQVIHCPLQVRR